MLQDVILGALLLHANALVDNTPEEFLPDTVSYPRSLHPSKRNPAQADQNGSVIDTAEKLV
jgi:hypothetical protein